MDTRLPQRAAMAEIYHRHPLSGVTPVTRVRSTLLSASLAALREHGHIERYREHVAPPVFERLQEVCMAPAWVPLELALLHYQACEGMRLDAEELAALGRGVSERIQGSFLATLARSARATGLSPWIPLGRFQVVVERVWEGGTLVVLKLGPKDAQVEILENPLMAIPYVRRAAAGVLSAALSLFARKLFVKVVRTPNPGVRADYRVTWV